MMRLDKFLSNIGIGSRKEVKKLLASKRVSVNGQIIKDGSLKVDECFDKVAVDNQECHYQAYYYFLMNKPKGYISATEDSKHKTVIDLLDSQYRNVNIFPVGRLDIDTTGLLLLTNNGDMAHQLLSPSKKVSKNYSARVNGIVSQFEIDQFAMGLDLGDFLSKPALLKVVSFNLEKGESQIEVEIHEGKFHQVKRMFHKVGMEVLELHRMSMGPLFLNEAVKLGTYRRLSENEKQAVIEYGYKE